MELTNEQCGEYVEKIVSLAESAGCKVCVVLITCTFTTVSDLSDLFCVCFCKYLLASLCSKQSKINVVTGISLVRLYEQSFFSFCPNLVFKKQLSDLVDRQ